MINAIREGNISRTKNLLNQGANPNQKRDNGSTPLSTAGFHGETEIVKLLLKSGADISRANNDGNTPPTRCCLVVQTSLKYTAKGGPQ